MPLALKYRPRRFEDLVGQNAVQVFLRQMVATSQVPRALLFEGSRGTGKTTTARILAAALNCDNRDHAALRSEQHPPCGTCPSCTAVFDGSSVDVIEIDAASTGLVDDIRAMRQQLMHRVGTGAMRVVIWDEAQAISAAGFNALLKTLEEPPPQTVFVLLTTERHKIPDTIASRCTPFTFRRLSLHDITTRLAQVAQTENYLAEPDLLHQLAEQADGAMRDALVLLEQVGSVGITTAEQYRRLIGHHDAAPAILHALAHHDLAAAYTHLGDALTRVADATSIITDLTTTLRDILVLRCGGEITKTGAALAARTSLALGLETPQAVACLKILWQLSSLRLGDTRSGLEMALAMMGSLFTPAPTSQPERLTHAQVMDHR